MGRPSQMVVRGAGWDDIGVHWTLVWFWLWERAWVTDNGTGFRTFRPARRMPS